MSKLPELFFAPNYSHIPLYQIEQTHFDAWRIIPKNLQTRITAWNDSFLDNFDHENGWRTGTAPDGFEETYRELAQELAALGPFTVVLNFWWLEE